MKVYRIKLRTKDKKHFWISIEAKTQREAWRKTICFVVKNKLYEYKIRKIKRVSHEMD